MDSATPVASALTINDGKIHAVGGSELKDYRHESHDLQDMGGAVILPGLTDSHMHLEHFSFGQQQVVCETETLDACLKNVAEKAASQPKGTWIQGWGWNQNVWTGGYGTAADLDRAAPDHPVFLSSKSGHASWGNSLAMKMAGIDSSTPDPEGGLIQRDETGKPTGIFFETANGLIRQIIPPATIDESARAIKDAQPALWAMGLTAVHDFNGARCFSALQKLNMEDALRLRVTKGIPLDFVEKAAAVGLRSGFGNDFLRIGSVKMFADGALGSQTAGMLEPLENIPDSTGIMLIDADTLFEHGKLAVEHGLSLAIHAIGDKANRVVLDGLERLRLYEKQHGISGLIHRIEHAQLLHPDDIARLANLAIVGSMQPIHTTSDLDISDKYWGSRSVGAFVFKTLLDLGTLLIFGSDAPVESPNPFYGLHAAVTRRRANGDPSVEGWHPEQKISLYQALQGFTTAPASVNGGFDRSGALKPGNYADLIVLAVDPFNLNPQELHSIKPEKTMVAGDWVWEAD